MHGVDLRLPGGGRVRFSPLSANAVGQARATVSSRYTGRLPAGSWLAIRMGTGSRGVAANPIAVTRPLGGRPYQPHRLAAVEAGPASRGPLRGHAASSPLHSPPLPGPHAAHSTWAGMRQGPVKYMLRDLVAATRVTVSARALIPAHGWYLTSTRAAAPPS